MSVTAAVAAAPPASSTGVRERIRETAAGADWFPITTAREHTGKIMTAAIGEPPSAMQMNGSTAVGAVSWLPTLTAADCPRMARKLCVSGGRVNCAFCTVLGGGILRSSR